MPITKSAKKSIRQDARRRKINMRRKKQLKSILKEIRALIDEGKLKEAKEKMPQAQKTIDKSVKTNIIKENKARRIKSKLEKAIAKSQ
jgi:small subunit ribosomal protein S20